MLRPLFVLLFLSACDDPAGADDPGEEPDSVPPALRLVEVASGLERPVFLTAPPDDDRLFLLEQPGRIRVVEAGRLLEEPFLDLVAQVRSGGERGLLGLAFHPDYASNGLFFVNYTNRGDDTRVERYRVSGDRNRADPASARLVLTVHQPYPNHNGGMIAFGPDGMLYVGMGDGGSAHDPHGHGQDRGTLLGAMLRLDVDAAEPYAVPPDNPFAGRADARPEIWAIGLRNPWRFSFDRETGDLYVGDVGQGRWEEVSVVPASLAGANFGWNVMEGAHCYRADGCEREGLVIPVVEHSHASGDCSVTGGYVYRGSRIPGLRGHYLYGDYCTGRVRSFRYAGGEATAPRELDLPDIGRISSFGEDAEGELYVVSHDGSAYRFEEGEG